MRLRPLLLAVPVLLVWGALVLPARAADRDLKVMSFNIRYGTAQDGENHWDKRREFLFDVVREQDADIIGLQEALHFQIDAILKAVPVYGVVGVGRDDGKQAGEYSAILYRTGALTPLDSGTFWFSDRPTKPGSTSWGNRIPRICTWARFRTREGRTFFVYNVHLDHESQPSRERSVEALAQRIASRTPTGPVIVTGDFNADEQNVAMRRLLQPRDQEPAVRLVDTFRVRHPNATGVGTFNGFEFGQIDERKIDYVLVGPRIEVLSAEIVHTSREQRYPSDHFPVTARVRLPERRATPDSR